MEPTRTPEQVAARIQEIKAEILRPYGGLRGLCERMESLLNGPQLHLRTPQELAKQIKTNENGTITLPKPLSFPRRT